MKRLLFVSLVCAVFGISHTASATPAGNFLVLGVIASSHSQQGVALLKNMSNNKTFAIREGRNFDKTALLKSVGRKYIEVVIDTKTYKLKVGDDTATAMADAAQVSSYIAANAEREISKDGNTINVSTAYKEHLINTDLSKILMQAAAVPKYEGGRLKGFQLWEIEPDSVFEMAGLKDGDLITTINGHEINDVGMTIRQLTSLKSASEATFNFIRNGSAQELKIVVQ